MNRIAFLQTTDVLDGLAEPVLQQIDSCLIEVKVRAGTTVFYEGDTGDAIYFIVQGSLNLETSGVVLVARKPGECVGEFALIDDLPRSVSAVAGTDAMLLKWQRIDFERLLKGQPELARGIFRMLTRKLREDVATQRTAEIEKERWKQDLERARQIQAGMLPLEDLDAARLEISGYCSPASGVGGDFYDYVALDDGKVGTIICDVTGHGFYSALFVAMAKSCLHTQVRIAHDPRDVVDAMMRALTLSIRKRLLMTCFYVLFDPQRGVLSYANAGHPYPYHLRSGSIQLEQLIPIDTILGAQEPEDVKIGQRERNWNTGDLLVMYTDGITEARDAQGHMFGHARLEKSILENRTKPPVDIKNAILGALAAHCGKAAQSDDVALVVARAV